MAAGNTVTEVESYVNSDIGRKTQTKDSDSSDRVVERVAERNSSSAGVTDATDCNCTWAALVVDNVKDSCISASGKSVEDYRDN